jgi:hypothetical protein
MDGPRGVHGPLANGYDDEDKNETGRNAIEYGAAPCLVNLFGTEIDAIAVTAGDERWICDRKRCQIWLASHGLSMDEADQVIQDGLEQSAAEANQ